MPPVTQQPTPTENPTTPPIVPQPASSAQNVGGLKPATKENVDKQKKVAFFLSLASLGLLVLGLLFGFTLPFAAVLGAYALYVGIRTKTKKLIVLGSIGLVLNFAVYILAVLTN